MKVPSIIIVVAAALALAVPSGFAATARTAPELGHSGGASVQTPAFVAKTLKALRAQLKILTAKNAALAGKNKKLLAQIRALEAQIAGLRAQPPVPVPLPLPDLPLDDCLASGNGCTHEQECTIWGYNCFLVEQPAQVAPLSESSSGSTEEAGSTGNIASGDVATTESSSSDATTTTNGPVANLIEENWDC